jgi:hypothetical protein
MARFRRKPVRVEAVQLRWDNWDEMCEHADVGNCDAAGCYIDAEGRVTDGPNGRLLLKIPGVGVAVQGDWIVRMPDGGLEVFKPAAFAALFESHADYKLDFEPDWKKYMELASIVFARPRHNAYWNELRELLVEARADAVQYVHDVKAEELAAARADERDVQPAPPHSERWGVYCLDGPAAGMWCGIETDERAARTIASLFHERTTYDIPGGYRYEARRLP